MNKCNLLRAEQIGIGLLKSDWKCFSLTYIHNGTDCWTVPLACLSMSSISWVDKGQLPRSGIRPLPFLYSQIIRRGEKLKHITHIQDIHNIAGPLVPYNHACSKRGLVHRDRVMQLMKQVLYLQATMAGSFIIIGGCLLNYKKINWYRG